MPAGSTRVVMYMVILFAGIAHNLFLIPVGVVWSDDRWLNDAIGYDSGLVLNRLVPGDTPWHPLAPLVVYWSERGTTDWYGSQVGLQGIILAGVRQQLGGELEHFAVPAASAFALLTAAILALFFLDLAQRIGPVAGNAGVAATVLMPILLPFATSLYWVAFLLFAPFVWSWWIYPRAIGQPVRLFGWLLGVGLFTLLKCLCGYEYVTTIVLSPLVAVGYHGVREARPLRSWLVHALLGVLAGAAGFALALALHIWQLNAVAGVDGLAAIRDRASHRTGVADRAKEVGYPFATPDPVFLPERWRLPARCFANYFWQPAFALPTSFGSAARELSLGRATLLLMLLAGWIGATWRHWPRAVSALVPALGLGLAASISWQLLAINHMCVHPHLNPIVFVVPFLLIGVALLGGILQAVADRLGISGGADSLALLVFVMVVVGNTGVMAMRVREEDRRQRAAADAVREHLKQGINSQPPAFPFSVDSLTPLRWPPYPGLVQAEERRLRPEVQGQPEPCAVVLGWIYQPPTQRKQPMPPPVALVVVRAGQVVNADTRRFRRFDVETLAGRRIPDAGFRLVVPDQGTNQEPWRLFAVDQERQVWELPLPGTRQPWKDHGRITAVSHRLSSKPRVAPWLTGNQSVPRQCGTGLFPQYGS